MARYKGATIPSPIDPPGTRRMVICVPDTVEWVSLVTGCMVQMTFGWYWNKDSGDYLAVTERARQMYFEFCDQNGLCDVIDCDEVAACIEENERARAAVRSVLGGNPANPPGYEMTPGQKTTNLVAGSNPSCDPEILYGQCIQVLQWTNQAVVDVLEKIEVTSNTVELVDALSEFPLIGWIKEAIGGQITLDMMQYYQNALIEQYNAQYTQELEDEIACEIYCLCAPDCEIIIERIFEVYRARLETYITVPALSDLVDLIEFVAGVAQDSTFVVELAHFFAWGSAALGNFFFAKAFNALLSEVLQDASGNGGYVDCDCVDFWEKTWDLELENAGLSVASSAAKWTFGVGWEVNSPTNTNTIAVQRLLPAGVYTQIRVEADVAPAYVSLIQVRTDLEPAGSVINQQRNEPGTAVTIINGNWTNPGAVLINYSKTPSTTLSGYAGKLKSITFRGTGVEPTW